MGRSGELEATPTKSRLLKGAEESRSLLQPSLAKLQRLEETTVGSDRQRVMEVNERLAEIVGTLYKLGATDAASHSDAEGIVRNAYEKLELTLKLMDDLPPASDEQRNVAKALSLLFALGAGSRSTVPPLRRSSASMQAVTVPKRPKLPASSPAIELGEIDAQALGIDLDQLDGASEPPPPEATDQRERSEPPSGADRRSYPRIGFEVEVGFVSETHFYAGLSMDVSEGGLFVATYQLQPVGSQVAVTFVLPNGHAVTTNAVVRWVREQSDESSPGMGLQLDLEGEDLKQVKSFCQRREPLFIDME